MESVRLGSERKIRWSELTRSERSDVASNVYDRSIWLQKNVTVHDLLYEIDGGDPLMRVGTIPTRVLYSNVVKTHSQSQSVVDNLAAAIESGSKFDRVIVSGSKFIDGGHRVRAFAAAKIPDVQVVDIANLLSVDWEKYWNGEEDIKE